MSSDLQAPAMRKPLRWPLVQQFNNRSSDWTRDARLVNAFAEKDPNTGEWQIQKRIGYIPSGASLVGGLGRGMYTLYDAPVSNAIIALAIIGNGTNAYLFVGGGQNATAMSDSSGNWNITETQTPTRYVVMTMLGNGSAGTAKLYLYNETSAAITTPALPSGRGNYIVGCAYLDNTTYFMDENCNIWGSNINDPTSYTSLNVVTAQKVPGWGVGFVKQLSYLIALKTASMEVFYDAGNATGSPLLQIDGATNGFGCAAHDLIQVIDDVILYPSSNLTGSIQIVRVDNLIPSVISTPSVDKLLSGWLSAGAGNFYSFSFKHFGHRFYGITNFSADLTLVFDLDQNLWYQWTSPTGGYFPMCGTAMDSSHGHQFIHAQNGNIYTFDSDYKYPTDANVVAPVDIYTPTTDFGTRRRKTLHRMYVRADQVTGASAVNPLYYLSGSTLKARRSDDDMLTWSNFRALDLSKKEPFLDGEGSFVKRAYHFRYTAANSLRIRSTDLQMDFGTI